MYDIEIKRQNGANIYTETYSFENKEDAQGALFAMLKAQNVTVALKGESLEHQTQQANFKVDMEVVIADTIECTNSAEFLESLRGKILTIADVDISDDSLHTYYCKDSDGQYITSPFNTDLNARFPFVDSDLQKNDLSIEQYLKNQEAVRETSASTKLN